MNRRLRRSILDAMWSDLKRIGLKRSDFTDHLKQLGQPWEKKCIVWFQHKTEHNNFSPIVSDGEGGETFGEGGPIYLAIVYREVYYLNPETEEDWDFPISGHDMPELSDEEAVAVAMGMRFCMDIDGKMRTTS